MKGRERRPKKERKSVIWRAETDEAQPVLKNAQTELEITILWPEHIFDASLHI
jgi:hypothetical protein